MTKIFFKLHLCFIGGVYPTTSHVGSSKILEKVKGFLPKLEAAEVSLQTRIDAGENVNLEKIDDEENSHIEMNLGFTDAPKSSQYSISSGSSDSEPDSPPSPAERDNSYTSDSDVDTSSSTSSCSCEVRSSN